MNDLHLYSDTQALVSFSNSDYLALGDITIPSGSSAYMMIDDRDNVRFVSLTLYHGVPWIAYSDLVDGLYTLRLAHMLGTSTGNCGTSDLWDCEVLDDDGSVGMYPSLKINSAGMAYISYYDDANGDLKLAYTRLFSFMPLLNKP